MATLTTLMPDPTHALDLILQQFNRLKNPKIIKKFNILKLCTRYFRHTYGLSYAHKIQYHLMRGDGSLTIDNIDRH